MGQSLERAQLTTKLKDAARDSSCASSLAPLRPTKELPRAAIAWAEGGSPAA